MTEEELKITFRQCEFVVFGQCAEQAGDNEDLTLDEFNEMMGGCKYATICPFSQYSVKK